MTGKDAILNYLKTHKTCSSPDVAAASGMTHTCINQAANILAKQGGTGSGSPGVEDGLLPVGHGRRNFRQKEHQSDFQRVSAKPGDETGTGCLRENISMTITIQAVNELIASLESAGEPSIREQKFLKLAKAHVQLAAENVVLKAAFNKPDAWLSFHSIPPTYQEPDRGGEYLAVHEQPGEKNDDGSDSWPVYAKPEIETPATDRIVAEAEARGVEKFAAHLRANDNGASVCKMIALGADDFAKQLREGADK